MSFVHSDPTQAPPSSSEGPVLPQYPTISFRLDRQAYQALGIVAGQKGSSPSSYAKGALCLALAKALREFAAQTETAAAERGFTVDLNDRAAIAEAA